MSADLNCLMGEVIEDPQQQPTPSEDLLLGLLKALLREHVATKKTVSTEVGREPS